MTCFRCPMPVPASRYGHTGTLCPACVEEWKEETERMAASIERDTGLLREVGGLSFLPANLQESPNSEHATTSSEGPEKA